MRSSEAKLKEQAAYVAQRRRGLLTPMSLREGTLENGGVDRIPPFFPRPQ
jgi:hypothetical protein